MCMACRMKAGGALNIPMAQRSSSTALTAHGPGYMWSPDGTTPPMQLAPPAPAAAATPQPQPPPTTNWTPSGSG